MKKFALISVAALLLTGCETQQAQNNAAEQAQDNAVQVAQPPLEQIQTERVHLIWNSGLNKWMVKLNNGSEQDPDKAQTKLDKDSGVAMFIVDIAGNSPSNPTFKDPGGLTVWEGNDTDPKSTPPNNPTSNQIVGPVVVTFRPNNEKKLVFWDRNQGNKVRIFYSINLTDGTSIDPIIDNGGGTAP